MGHNWIEFVRSLLTERGAQELERHRAEPAQQRRQRAAVELPFSARRHLGVAKQQLNSKARIFVLKPGYHFVGSRDETGRGFELYGTTGFNLYSPTLRRTAASSARAAAASSM
jgi:hypothetical protein